MSRFAGALKEISERVSLPQPARRRVLIEIAGDLDDLYRAFLERGASEEDAEREALGRIDLSDEVLRELAAVHGGWFRRLSDAVARRAGSQWELGLLAGLVLAGVFLSGAVLQAVPIARAAGGWIYPVTFVALVTTGIGAWKALVLWPLGDHRPRGLHRGLPAMLGLSVLQLFLAFGGLWFTAYSTFQAIRLEPSQASGMTLQWLLGALALLVMGLSLALSGGLAWFVLLGKVSSIEKIEATTLLRE
jgi:hypothetical protein